jgi:hypothetical protein
MSMYTRIYIKYIFTMLTTTKNVPKTLLRFINQSIYYEQLFYLVSATFVLLISIQRVFGTHWGPAIGFSKAA